MKKLNLTSKLSLVFGLIVISFVLHAEVRVSTSKNTVEAGEVFSIRFTYTGTNPNANPDFSPLNQDFEIISSAQSQSSSIQIINGVRTQESKKEYELSVITKRPGIITIPAISFGVDSSRPQVIQATPNQAISSGNFFMEIDTYPKQAYVFEQFEISYTFYHAESLVRPNFTSPKMDGVPVEVQALQQTQGQIQKNGRIYGYVNQRFLITPKQSGNLSVGPFGFTGFVNAARPLRIYEESDSLNIQIKSVPPGVNANTWFPAKDVNIYENYSGFQKQVEVGSPIVRQIQIDAKSVGSNLIPNFEMNSGANLSVYSDKVQVDRKGMDITASQTFTIIPTKTGVVEIPKFQFYWWDLSTDQMKVAELPAQKINVVASQTNPNASNNQNSTPAAGSQNPNGVNQAMNNNPSNSASESGNQTSSPSNQSSWVVWLLSSLLALSLLAVGFLVMRVKKISQHLLSDEQKNQSETNQEWIGSDIKKIKQAKKKLENLKVNLKSQELNAARNDILEFAKIFYADKSSIQKARALLELDEIIGEDFAAIRKQIDSNLFNQTTHSIDGDRLVKAIENFLIEYQKAKKIETKHTLAKL